MHDHYLHLSTESLIPTLDPNQLVKIEDEIMKITGMSDDCWKGDIVWGFHLGASPAEKRAVVPVLVLYPLTQHTHDAVSKAVNGSPVFYINVDRRFMATLVVIAPKTDRNSIAFCENYKVLQSLSSPHMDSEHIPLTNSLYLQRRSSEDDYLPPELYRLGESAEVAAAVEIPDIHQVHGLREKHECSTLSVRVKKAADDQAAVSELKRVREWASIVLPMIGSMSGNQRLSLAKMLWAMEDELSRVAARRSLKLTLPDGAGPQQVETVLGALYQFCSTQEQLSELMPLLLSQQQSSGPSSLLLGKRLTPEDAKIIEKLEANLFLTDGGAVASVDEESANSFYHCLYRVVTGRWLASELGVVLVEGDRRKPIPMAVNLHRGDVGSRNNLLWRASDKEVTDIIPKALGEIHNSNVADTRGPAPDLGNRPVQDNCAVMRRQAEAAPGARVAISTGQDRGPGTPINVQ